MGKLLAKGADPSAADEVGTNFHKIVRSIAFSTYVSVWMWQRGDVACTVACYYGHIQVVMEFLHLGHGPDLKDKARTADITRQLISPTSY